MAMTTAEGTAAINTALAAQLADFGAKRASQTQLSPEDDYNVNTDLAAKLSAALLVAVDAAWSD